ncbi:MAG: acetyl-CoA carboxylase biotin carboxyl carrier protein [Planctomycetes bacterium]|nr:acetyl-CoA carboxylase biotin carboxyl carrier protein [Planctomycetota bacterium]
MNFENLKRLAQLMTEHGLSELEVEDPEGRYRLKKAGPEGRVIEGPALSAPGPGASAPVPAAPAPGLHEIKAPLVGTFYRSPKPGADVFVETGDRIGPEKVVCIIEAMKVMNEIKAECEGEIVEVCIENGQPVEFGQVLFRVRKP